MTPESSPLPDTTLRLPSSGRDLSPLNAVTAKADLFKWVREKPHYPPLLLALCPVVIPGRVSSTPYEEATGRTGYDQIRFKVQRDSDPQSSYQIRCHTPIDSAFIHSDLQTCEAVFVIERLNGQSKNAVPADILVLPSTALLELLQSALNDDAIPAVNREHARTLFQLEPWVSSSRAGSESYAWISADLRSLLAGSLRAPEFSWTNFIQDKLLALRDEMNRCSHFNVTPSRAAFDSLHAALSKPVKEYLDLVTPLDRARIETLQSAAGAPMSDPGAIESLAIIHGASKLVSTYDRSLGHLGALYAHLCPTDVPAVIHLARATNLREDIFKALVTCTTNDSLEQATILLQSASACGLKWYIEACQRLLKEKLGERVWKHVYKQLSEIDQHAAIRTSRDIVPNENVALTARKRSLEEVISRSSDFLLDFRCLTGWASDNSVLPDQLLSRSKSAWNEQKNRPESLRQYDSDRIGNPLFGTLRTRETPSALQTQSRFTHESLPPPPIPSDRPQAFVHDPVFIRHLSSVSEITISAPLNALMFPTATVNSIGPSPDTADQWFSKCETGLESVAAEPTSFLNLWPAIIGSWYLGATEALATSPNHENLRRAGALGDQINGLYDRLLQERSDDGAPAVVNALAGQLMKMRRLFNTFDGPWAVQPVTLSETTMRSRGGERPQHKLLLDDAFLAATVPPEIRLAEHLGWGHVRFDYWLDWHSRSPTSRSVKFSLLVEGTFKISDAGKEVLEAWQITPPTESIFLLSRLGSHHLNRKGQKSFPRTLHSDAYRIQATRDISAWVEGRLDTYLERTRSAIKARDHVRDDLLDQAQSAIVSSLHKLLSAFQMPRTAQSPLPSIPTPVELVNLLRSGIAESTLTPAGQQIARDLIGHALERPLTTMNAHLVRSGADAVRARWEEEIRPLFSLPQSPTHPYDRYSFLTGAPGNAARRQDKLAVQVGAFSHAAQTLMSEETAKDIPIFHDIRRRLQHLVAHVEFFRFAFGSTHSTDPELHAAVNTTTRLPSLDSVLKKVSQPRAEGETIFTPLHDYVDRMNRELSKGTRGMPSIAELIDAALQRAPQQFPQPLILLKNAIRAALGE